MNEHIQTQLTRIDDKLEQLRIQDSTFQIFGAFHHQYQLNTIQTEAEITAFEQKYQILLPADYRAFLLQIGDGGAGPYYGLERLADGIYESLDDKNEEFGLVNISADFRFTESWNLLPAEEEVENEIDEEAIYDAKWADGMLRISNYGCGISINLVVQGNSYGEIWVDDRFNDAGIYPDHYFNNSDRLHFLDWYELWLDQSLQKVASLIPTKS